MSKKRLYLSACPLYLFFWMGDAFLSSYYSLFFIERGIGGNERAILLGIIPFALFAGCLALSAIAKTRSRALWLFRICAILEAGLVFAYAFTESFPALLALTFALGFFNGAPFALIEGYVVPLAEESKGHYSTIRLFGSLGYIISLGLGFFVLKEVPVHNCFFWSFAFFLVAFGTSFLFRAKDELPNRPEPTENPAKPALKIKTPIVLFWICQFLCFGAFTASQYLLPVRLNELGFLDADYSLARAIAVVVEMALLLTFPFYAKIFKNKKVPLIIAGSLLILATVSGSFLSNPWALAYVNMGLGHIGKAFLFAFEAMFVEELVGSQSLSKALTIKYGGVNLVCAALNLSSSSLVDGMGFPGFFLLLAGIMAVGFSLLFFIRAPKTSNQ